MKISYGNSRFETKWKNSEITWEDFKKRVSSTIRTTETIEEYRQMTKAQQANVKDKGGFVAGHLKGGRRKKNTVLCRSALVLDMDYGTPGVWDDVIAKQPYRCYAYSTHKHTADKPRLRIVIPLSREVSKAEYPAVARMAAKDIGIDLFDDSTYEAHRLMYWPSTSMNGDFFYQQCNHKYGHEKCSTPHLTEEEIKAAFVRAANKALEDKDTVIETFRLIRDSVFDTSALEQEKAELTDELNIVAGLIQDGIYQNAHVTQNQA
ncbi:MAG: hypothetical protein SPH90_00205, partial [Candidatus Alectryocaccobium sp.]|nr:hypothetical protein [Candidatus Alectryocaccobium sp.]